MTTSVPFSIHSDACIRASLEVIVQINLTLQALKTIKNVIARFYDSARPVIAAIDGCRLFIIDVIDHGIFFYNLQWMLNIYFCNSSHNSQYRLQLEKRQTAIKFLQYPLLKVQYL